MKTISLLLATSVLAASAGAATAEIALSGDARMGITNDNTAGDWQFTSRARVTFTMSGTTDGGLEFGASFRADSAASAANGTAGEVYISGAFGRLSMGDVDGAAAAAAGQVDQISLTDLDSLNEIFYIANGGTDFQAGAGQSDDPSFLYAYSAGDFTAYASATNPTGDVQAYAAGLKYTLGDYTFSLGYETADLPLVAVNIDQVVLGGSATLGAFTLKAVLARADISTFAGNFDQMAVSGTYAANGMSVTAFYRDNEDWLTTPIGGDRAYGIGASYDLGGGASVRGGYVSDRTNDQDIADFGVDFSF
ncbi:MAG: porin [Rhodobacteraceae bacterium]|nr:porin [Paracoccaceae bacterium]